MTKLKLREFLRKGYDGLTGMISSNRASFAFFIGLLATVLVYRIQLTIGLFTHPVKPFDFNPGQHPVWFTLAYLPYDLVFILGCFLLSWLLSRMTYFSNRAKPFHFKNFRTYSIASCFNDDASRPWGPRSPPLRCPDRARYFRDQRGIFWHFTFETIKFIEIRDYLFLFFPFVLFGWFSSPRFF